MAIVSDSDVVDDIGGEAPPAYVSDGPGLNTPGFELVSLFGPPTGISDGMWLGDGGALSLTDIPELSVPPWPDAQHEPALDALSEPDPDAGDVPPVSQGVSPAKDHPPTASPFPPSTPAPPTLPPPEQTPVREFWQQYLPEHPQVYYDDTVLNYYYLDHALHDSARS